jgi:hypothetical protein
VLEPAATVNKDVLYSTYLDYAADHGMHHTSKSWFFRDLETATAGKVRAERVQRDGERVHNIVGARISAPPPKRWTQTTTVETTESRGPQRRGQTRHERVKAGVVVGRRH